MLFSSHNFPELVSEVDRVPFVHLPSVVRRELSRCKLNSRKIYSRVMWVHPYGFMVILYGKLLRF